MTDFLAEVYTPKLEPTALAQLADRMGAAVESLSASGCRVRYLRSIHVPEDETCFHLFESESADIVREVGRSVGLVFDRVSAAVEPIVSRGD